MNVWLKEQVQNRKQAGLLALFLVILAGGIITLCLVGASDARLFGRMRVVPTKAGASEEIPQRRSDADQKRKACPESFPMNNSGPGSFGTAVIWDG